MESQNQLPSTQVLPKGTTFARTCINGINVLAGVGILSIPFALAEGGWVSLVFLFIVAAICGYTGLLLKRCMDKNPSVRSYPDIGGMAFGVKGKILVSIFVYMELYLVAVEFLILEGDNLQKLFPRDGLKIGSVRVGGKEMYMMCSALVIMPTTWVRSLGLLAYVSFGGVLASAALILCVAWLCVADGIASISNQRYDLFSIRGLPTSVSLFAFCFCGHAVFPMLCNSMKNKAQFPKVLVVCFVGSAASYGSMAILGYLMYGKDVKSQITLNLPIDKVITKIAIYTTLINPITKYAAITNPIAIAIEDAFCLATTRMAILIRTLLLITTLIVALSVPYFAYVMAFTGAFLSITTTILIPCSCYLKINKPPAPPKFGFEFLFIVAIFVVGFFVALFGTFSSVKEIVKRL